MGALLAKCLPVKVRETVTDTIPDLDDLYAIAEKINAFEKALAVKKCEKVEQERLKKIRRALKTWR